MNIEISTIGGKTINIDFAAKKATIEAIGLSGRIDGRAQTIIPAIARKLPPAAKGATHYLSIAGQMVVLAPGSGEKYNAAYGAVLAAECEAEQARLEAAVPGVHALRAAYDGETAYQDAFERMMADEQNDGVNPPRRPASNSDELAAQYPRAVVYLRAEGYSCAAHDLKASAGRKAMNILASGGSIEDAENILSNWLPASVAWN